MLDLHVFFEDTTEILPEHDLGYHDGQIGAHIKLCQNDFTLVESADIVMIGIGEYRGDGEFHSDNKGVDAIRKQFYQLHYWHKNISIADMGNLKKGAAIKDSYAALKTVLTELLKLNKTVVLIGGSHDLTLPQYFAYKDLKKFIDVACVDSKIDLMKDLAAPAENFLLEMLTSDSNYVKHYNHIGFQSYLVHPVLLERMDKLRFDCFRLGVVKEKMDEMEPVIRNSHLFSFDIRAIKYSDAPANYFSPNGFTGEEACTLTRFAGMSNKMSSFGIYGYHHADDVHELTAKQIAQMLWYFVDGRSKLKNEDTIEDRLSYNEFNTAFAELDTVFLQNKKTNRWWMQLPDKKFTACSYNDYVIASNNQVPERWLRAQERI